MLNFELGDELINMSRAWDKEKNLTATDSISIILFLAVSILLHI